LPKGFPGDLKGRVKSLVKELEKERILLVKPTSYGKEVSINNEKIDKIMEYIEKFLDK